MTAVTAKCLGVGTTLLQAVADTVAAVIAPQQHLLAAISGGADSTALALVLAEIAPRLQLRVSAAHLHHGVRGREADDDASLAADLAARLGFEFVLGRLPPGLVGSDEATLRQARLDFLRRVRHLVGAERIVLGHHLEDQAETLLLGLLRGSGIDGLGGMAGDTGLVLRPLLGVHRQMLRAIVDEAGLGVADDAMNRDRRYQRVRLRLDLVPWLEAERPGAAARIARTAAYLRDEREVLEREAARLFESDVRQEAGGLRLEPGLSAAPAALRRRVVAMALRSLGMVADGRSLQDVDDVLCGRRRGAPLPRRGRVRASLQGTHLLQRTAAPVALAIDGPARILFAGGVWLEVSATPIAGALRVTVGQVPLTIRTWRAGDRLPGGEKLKQVFDRQRMDSVLRHQLPVVLSADGVVLMAGRTVCDEAAGDGPWLWIRCGLPPDEVSL